MLAVENDCEDQGFSLLSDGCMRCKVQLEKTERLGSWWWMCPRCHGSYGQVDTGTIHAAHLKGLHTWSGPGPEPASWYASDGTKVYRSRADAIDD